MTTRTNIYYPADLIRREEEKEQEQVNRDAALADLIHREEEQKQEQVNRDADVAASLVNVEKEERENLDDGLAAAISASLDDEKRRKQEQENLDAAISASLDDQQEHKYQHKFSVGQVITFVNGDAVFRCPHVEKEEGWTQYIVVAEGDVRCGQFRCGIGVSPHASKEECDKYTRRTGLCCRPFTITKNPDGTTYKVQISDYN